MTPKPPDILRKSHAHEGRKQRATAKLELKHALERGDEASEETALALRAATPADADALAELVNEAGDGLPLYLWRQLAAPGEDPWEVGRERARREQGGFSYRNAVLVTSDDAVAACLIGYPLPEEPEAVDPATLPALFVPLVELEQLAPGTWYLNVIATRSEFRGRGIGRALLAHADELAAAAHSRGVSLIVSDANVGARRLYERSGYRERARRAMVKDGWRNPGEHWLLLIKEF